MNRLVCIFALDMLCFSLKMMAHVTGVCCSLIRARQDVPTVQSQPDPDCGADVSKPVSQFRCPVLYGSKRPAGVKTETSDESDESYLLTDLRITRCFWGEDGQLSFVSKYWPENRARVSFRKWKLSWTRE